MLLDSTCRQNAKCHAWCCSYRWLACNDAVTGYALISWCDCTHFYVICDKWFCGISFIHDTWPCPPAAWWIALLFAFHENASPQMMQQHATFDSCAEAAQYENVACLSANMTKPYAGICQPDASSSHVLVHHSTGYELHLTWCGLLWFIVIWLRMAKSLAHQLCQWHRWNSCLEWRHWWQQSCCCRLSCSGQWPLT